LHVAVFVHNFGPDDLPRGAYSVTLTSSRGDSGSYLGYEGNIGTAGPFGSSPISGPLPDLKSGDSVTVYFVVKLARTGPDKLTATVSSTSPTDPNLANNKGDTTIDVTAHGQFSGVHANYVLGQELVSGTAQAWGFARDAKAHTKRAVEIALFRTHHGRCSWLVGASGKFFGGKRLSCTQPVWLRTVGSRHWSYAIHERLQKGEVTVLVRQVAPPSRREHEFGTKLHNLFKLRIR
jgi:hypothetical protein